MGLFEDKEGDGMYYTFECTNAQAAQQGLKDFYESVLDFLSETDGAPPRDVLDQMAGFKTAVNGNSLVIRKGFESVPGWEMYQQPAMMATEVFKSFGLSLGESISSKNSLGDLLNMTLNTMSQAWEFNLNVSARRNWKEIASQTAEQMMGSAEMFNSTPAAGFKNFEFVGRMRNKDGQDAKNGKALVTSFLKDIPNGMAPPPVANAIEQCENMGDDCLDMSWQTEKGRLAPMFESAPFKPSQFPFVNDFIQNWKANVNCDMRSTVVVNGVNATWHLRTDGMGVFVQDVLDLWG